MGLACSGIRKQYGGFVALDGVSVRLEDGQILGIAGPNGAGKTTLFDVLSGYLRPEAGRVELDGRDVTGVPAHRRARLGLARTFQSPLVPTALTVGETLDAARLAWSPKLDRKAVQDVRRLVYLVARDDELAGELDALARRKLLLACLFLRRPTVLLLDEPCSGLVQEEIDEIDEIIRTVRDERGIGVAIVEHRLELLFAVAERVLVLDEGKQIAEGAPEDVFQQPAVRMAYFEAPKAVA